MPTAEVHAVFRDTAAALQADADALAKATAGAAQRRWQIGPVGGWDGDPLQVAGMAARFDRGPVGQNYAECLADQRALGSVGSAQALVLQSDYVAAQERAFRVRHATSVRCAAHAAGRRRGHADDRGVIRAGVIRYVEDLVKRGAKA